MVEVLTEPQWRAREASHHARVDALTAGHRQRRSAGVAHPGEDFLFTYYPFKPAALRRWHPGAGLDLEGAARTERATWRFARLSGDRVGLDEAAYLKARSSTVAFVRDLLAATAGRSPHFGCFALHEWAMVYRLDQDTVRHRGLPLRLGPAGSDAVVDAQTLTCTHFDAFRFFTDPARRDEILTRLRQSGRDLVELTEDQIAAFAGNAIELQGAERRILALSSTAFAALRPDQIALIEQSATLVPLPIPTIEMAGGSVRCTIAGIHLAAR